MTEPSDGDNAPGPQVAVEQLAKGMFVDLSVAWHAHPFLFSRFKIKTDKDLAAIRQLGLRRVTVITRDSFISTWTWNLRSVTPIALHSNARLAN